MTTRITNRARHMIIVTLNSGATIHLAAGEQSAALDDLELNGNRGIEKLVRYGLAEVSFEAAHEEVHPPGAAPAARRGGAS